MPLVLEPSWVGSAGHRPRRVLASPADGPAAFADVVGDLCPSTASPRPWSRPARRGRGPRWTRSRSPSPCRRRPPTSWRLEAIVARGWQPERDRRAGRLAAARDRRVHRPGQLGAAAAAPGVPLDDALAPARAWYAGRGLPLRLACPDRGPPTARRRARPSAAGGGSRRSHVMAAPPGRAAAAPSRRQPVRIGDAPDDAWLALVPRRRGPSRARPGAADPARPGRVRGRSATATARWRSAAAPSTTAGSGSPRSRSRRRCAATGWARPSWRTEALGQRQRRDARLPAGPRRQRGRARAVRAPGLLGAPRLPLPPRLRERPRLARTRPYGSSRRRTTASCSSSPSTTRCGRRSSCSPSPGCRRTKRSSCTTRSSSPRRRTAPRTSARRPTSRPARPAWAPVCGGCCSAPCSAARSAVWSVGAASAGGGALYARLVDTGIKDATVRSCATPCRPAAYRPGAARQPRLGGRPAARTDPVPERRSSSRPTCRPRRSRRSRKRSARPTASRSPG